MPASELGWPVSRTPVFQVFGVKRKSNFEDNNCEHAVSHESSEKLGSGAKRVCYRSDLEVNHNHTPPLQQQSFHEQHSQHDIQPHHDTHQQLLSNPVQQQHNQQVQDDIMQDAHLPSPWQQQGHPESHMLPHSQGTNIMDINEEVYSSPPAHDSTCTDSCMAMDDDCVPDPGQYLNPGDSDPQESTPQGITQGYHSQYCSSGDVSPTSGLVKCYCRPSWEGVAGLKPCFVSDYY